MRCSDLQIGDWVMPYIFGIASKPGKIVGISYNSYRGEDYVDWIDCDVWDELSLDDIKPIPLTSEILEKNGFTHCLTSPCGYYHAHACEISHILFHISEDTYEDTYHTVVFTDHNDNNFVLFNLCYVHELQHILRLCGLNDLADNLKLEK